MNTSLLLHMIWIYRILFLPVLLVMLPQYMIRMRKRGGYSQGFMNRFGFMPPLPDKVPGVTRIWLQAVSVGEIRAIRPIIDELNEDPKFEVVLTTTTTTGFALAQDEYSSKTLCTAVFPLDFWRFSARGWRHIQPDLILLMEGELWPEHLHRAKKKGVPVLLMNARLSDRSFKRYSKVKPIAKWLLGQVTRVLASAELDRQRFDAIGVPSVALESMGNLKFDVSIENLSDGRRAQLLKEIGFNINELSIILMGSSTWPGEEELLIDTLKKIRQKDINCMLILLPRHVERRDELARILDGSGLAWSQRSKRTTDREVCIHLADTMGEAIMFTQLADLVFVGKSLPPANGGQTPIEAAALGKPIVYGPMMTNFRAVCESLESHGAALKGEDAGSVQQLLLELLQDAMRRKDLSKAAQQWHAANRGAAQKCLSVIRQMTQI